jgi:hypothetical protein
VLTDDRRPVRLYPVISDVRRRVIANARAIGCTCPQPDIKWNPVEGVPVIRHDPCCPRARGDERAPRDP